MATRKKKGSENTVDAQHSDYVEWMESSDLPRTILGGTKAMKEAGKKYLPKDPLEKEDKYKNRLSRSVLVNMYGKTVSFLGGQVFNKNIVFEDGSPTFIDALKENIDLAGNSADIFLKRAFELGLGEGVIHIIVDSNNVDGEYTSKAEEKAAGVRPYFRMISGESVFAFVDEGGLLKQVRVYEVVTEQDGDFGVEEILQIRVLEPGRWRTFRLKDDSKDWALYEEGETSLDYIPMVSFIPGKQLSTLTGETPLMDLAELQLDHWQSKSDQKNILHVARVPLLFAKQIDLAVIQAGVSAAIGSDSEHADLKWVEISGKAIEAGQKDLTEIETKMALYGLQQLIPRTGNQTATEKAISSAESNSSLGCWVTDFESVVRKAFAIAADYEKEKIKEESISVNKDFSSGVIDLQMIEAYSKLVDDGILSAKSAFEEIKKKGFLSEELDWLEVSLEIENERQTVEGQSLLSFGKKQ